MDTLTQAALGAAVGQAGFAKSLGRKANWYGAAAGLTPDLDVIWGAFAGEWQSLVIHRGPTHALWFGPVVGTLLGWLTWKYYVHRATKRSSIEHDPPPPLKAWIGLWVLGLLTHPLLDVFTTTVLSSISIFEREIFPVWGRDHRPILHRPLCIALFIGYRNRAPPASDEVAQIALAISTLYLGYGVYQNGAAEERAAEELQTLGIETHELQAYPTIFQPWLRRIVARDTTQVCHLSALHGGSGHWVSQPHQLDHIRIRALLDTEEGQIFEWFADGQMIGIMSENIEDPIVIDDLRYGMVTTPTRGIWGMKAKVGPTGSVDSTPERYNNRPKQPQELLPAFWQTLMGTSSPTQPTLHSKPSNP